MIAACHRTAPTDRPRIVTLYDAPHAQVPSPTVALDRAIAVATTPETGLGRVSKS